MELHPDINPGNEMASSQFNDLKETYDSFAKPAGPMPVVDNVDHESFGIVVFGGLYCLPILTICFNPIPREAGKRETWYLEYCMYSSLVYSRDITRVLNAAAVWDAMQLVARTKVGHRQS